MAGAHPMNVKAQNLAAISYYVDSVAVNGGRRTDAQAHIVEIEIRLVRLKLRHNQLPEQLAVRLVEALHKTAACRTNPRVLQSIVIRTDKNAAVGNGWGA